MKKMLLQKRLFNYLGLMKFEPFFYLVFSILCLTQCTEPSEFEELRDYLEQEHSYTLSSEIQAVVVISDQGGCLNCNKAFADFMETYLKTPSILFVVASSGMNLYISAYLSYRDQENVILDRRGRFLNQGFIEKSGVLFIKDGQIETTQMIQLETLSEDLRFIESKLENQRISSLN